MNREPDVSIVVPCCNEGAVLNTFYPRLRDVCVQAGYNYEMIFVEDGSTDNTWDCIKRLANQDSRVVGLRLSRNHGHQIALTAGLANSRSQRVFMLDADLQDPPELLPEMMKTMDAGADIVYGKRRTRMGEPLWRLFAIRFFYKLLRHISETSIPEDNGDFRLINRTVLDTFNRMPEHHRFVRGMMSWMGFKQQEILYDRNVRVAGQSKYPFLKLLRLAIDGITAFSLKPLRLATCLALLLFLLAILSAVYLFVGRYLANWMLLIPLILFTSALQLLVLGIIGEYLARISTESKGRPLFMVSERT